MNQAAAGTSRTYAVVLGVLASAFLGRVVGQVLVAFFDVRFLPPMGQWQSGVLRYPLLLASQVVILCVQFEISRELWVGRGPLLGRREGAGRWLKWFSLVYFLSMVVRYAVAMAWFPERRWLGGAIPIVFHWVLALYLYLLSRYYRGLPAA